MFVIVIYAIVGLELFKGQLHATCYKIGTQKYENVSYKYGPNAPLLLVDPGDVMSDEDGVPFPCDDSYKPNLLPNASENAYTGRPCNAGNDEICIGRQPCFPVDPATGLYDPNFPIMDDCYHDKGDPNDPLDNGWRGWQGWRGPHGGIINFDNIIYATLLPLRWFLHIANADRDMQFLINLFRIFRNMETLETPSWTHLK